MLGKRIAQTSLFDVGALKAIRLKPDSFYAQLAAAAPTLYPDETFAALHEVRGRTSVPPSSWSRAPGQRRGGAPTMRRMPDGYPMRRALDSVESTQHSAEPPLLKG